MYQQLNSGGLVMMDLDYQARCMQEVYKFYFTFNGYNGVGQNISQCCFCAMMINPVYVIP